MHKYLKHPVVSSGLTTIGFTMVVHVFNYIYTLISIRYLTPIEYSDLALIVSFFAIMGVFSATLSNTALSLLSRRKSSYTYEETKQQILQSSTVFFYIIFIFAVLILTPVIHFWFKINSILEIIIILTAGLFSAGNSLLSVHFQLHKKFIKNGFFGMIAAMLKLILSIIFLYFGYKIFGVAIALLLSTLFSFLMFYPKKDIASYRQIAIYRRDYFNTTKIFIQNNKKFIWKNLVSSLILTVCLVIDTLLAKKLLSPEMAAQYIGMSTLAKLFFYTVAAINVVIFPYLLSKESYSLNKRALLLSYLSILLLGGLIIIGIGNFFSNIILTTILGSSYAVASVYLVQVLLVSISSTFASIMINLSSLFDANHFNKSIILILTLSVPIIFLINPHNIPTLTLSLICIFSLTTIILYNFCVKQHLTTQ